MRAIHLHDIFNIIGKLTIKRCLNAGKLYSSFILSRWLGFPIQWGLPLSVSIEPTTACNLSCPECPSGLKSFTRGTGSIQTDFFRQTIDQLHTDTLWLNFYFQGEPFLHKGFLDMVAYAASKNIYTTTSTNAHFFSDQIAESTVRSGLDRIIISIDGATQGSYEKYRIDGELNKVLEGASKLISWKKKLKSTTPFVVFQCILFRSNEHEKDRIRQLARQIGVNALWFKTAQVMDYENDPNRLIPVQQANSRYEISDEGHVSLKSKLTNRCWKMWHSNVITWDGQVVPCCFDKDAVHVMGKLHNRSIQEIWKNNNYHDFRMRLMKSRKNIDICSNCSEGLSIWR